MKVRRRAKIKIRQYSNVTNATGKGRQHVHSKVPKNTKLRISQS